jgi:hypothetical protein
MERINCPKCRWVPDPADRWECRPGCGHVWNTFDTRGVCPSCVKVWELTQCLACLRLSPHEDWYHGEGTELNREVAVEEKILAN